MTSVYQFNTLNLSTPVKIFSAKSYVCGSFYVKLAVSPDGRYICSGSSDSNVHIWEIEGPRAAPVLLSAHTKEITGVSWARGCDGVERVRQPFNFFIHDF
jgi:denticleless